jgi:hypothetical protein
MKNYAGERHRSLRQEFRQVDHLSGSAKVDTDGIADKFWKRNGLRISGHTSGMEALQSDVVSFGKKLEELQVSRCRSVP